MERLGVEGLNFAGPLLVHLNNVFDCWAPVLAFHQEFTYRTVIWL